MTIKNPNENIDLAAKRIIKLLDDSEIQSKDFADKIGVKPSAITDWRNGKTKSYKKVISKIADYFNVTVDYLLGRTDNPNSEKYPDNLMPLAFNEIVMFPVIGTITAGFDGGAVYDSTGEEIPVPSYLLKSHNAADYFVLQVKGNSMEPVYHDGDKVLIRKCISVDSGKVAAIGYDGEEATLKKVEYVKGENWMKLIPFNSAYPTKTIYGADLELCRVYGEFVYAFNDKNNIKDELDYLGIKNDKDTLNLLKKISSLPPEQKQLLLSMIDNMNPKKNKSSRQ